MRYLGIDLGTKRVGLAISDLTSTIATPLKTIIYDEINILKEIENIVLEYEINSIVMGLPKNMNNTIGDSAERALEFSKKLEDYFGFEVIMQDERKTTVEASNYMLEANLSRKKRKAKIDGLAASIILQTYLNRKKEGL